MLPFRKKGLVPSKKKSNDKMEGFRKFYNRKSSETTLSNPLVLSLRELGTNRLRHLPKVPQSKWQRHQRPHILNPLSLHHQDVSTFGSFMQCSLKGLEEAWQGACTSFSVCPRPFNVLPSRKEEQNVRGQKESSCTLLACWKIIEIF